MTYGPTDPETDGPTDGRTRAIIESLEKAWYNITSKLFNSPFKLMPRRIATVLEAEGGYKV